VDEGSRGGEKQGRGIERGMKVRKDEWMKEKEVRLSQEDYFFISLELMVTVEIGRK